VKPECEGIDLCCGGLIGLALIWVTMGLVFRWLQDLPLGPFRIRATGAELREANNVLLRPSGVWLGFGDASLADPGRMRTGCDALASGGEGVVVSVVPRGTVLALLEGSPHRDQTLSFTRAN